LARDLCSVAIPTDQTGGDEPSSTVRIDQT
jgi:hypothetical protein